MRMGVGTSTVSRWVNGRIPDARLIERIADVLVLDYDFVSLNAGYRPEGLDGVEDDIIKREILPMLRQIDFSDDVALERVKADLDFWIRKQKKDGGRR